MISSGVTKKTHRSKKCDKDDILLFFINHEFSYIVKSLANSFVNNLPFLQNCPQNTLVVDYLNLTCGSYSKRNTYKSAKIIGEYFLKNTKFTNLLIVAKTPWGGKKIFSYIYLNHFKKLRINIQTNVVYVKFIEKPNKNAYSKKKNSVNGADDAFINILLYNFNVSVMSNDKYKDYQTLLKMTVECGLRVTFEMPFLTNVDEKSKSKSNSKLLQITNWYRTGRHVVSN